MQKIGLVGLGFMGRTHLRAYDSITNCEVTAIYTRRKVVDEEINQTYNGSFVTTYDDLLNDEEIDIIDICLPTYLHEEFIIKAAHAGKHIICEKPLTLTVESAKRIIEIVHKNGVRLFVGQVLRFWPEYKKIKSYSERDKLINIDVVHAKRLGQKPTWSNWFQHQEKSGGALFDLHIHDIDFVTYLLGEVESVYAVGTKNDIGAWDHIMTTLSFNNKSIAYVEASHRMAMKFPFTMSFRAQASQHIIDFRFEGAENIENMQDVHNQFLYYTNEKRTTLEVEPQDAFQNALSYFIDCIDHKKENTIIPLKDVLYTQILLQAIEQSLENNEKISIPSFSINKSRS